MCKLINDQNKHKNRKRGKKTNILCQDQACLKKTKIKFLEIKAKVFKNLKGDQKSYFSRVSERC